MASAQPQSDAFNMSQMMKQLECPVCLDYCSPPIMLCVNGHNLCSSCRSLLTECPQCRGKMSIVRNIYAENMSELEYPCTNQSKGCTAKLLLKDMESHLSTCVFGKSKCLLHVSGMSPENRFCFSPCGWTGKSDALLEHVLKTHPESVLTRGATDASYKLRKQHVLLVSAHDQLFWSLLNFDLRSCDVRGAVFAVDAIEPPDVFTFQYDFESANGQLHVTKRGTVFNQGSSDKKYNSTIFQGPRVLDQLVFGKTLKFKIKIEKKMQ